MTSTDTMAGFLDMQLSDQYQKFYFILNKENSHLEYYTDCPSNLPQGMKCMSGSINLLEADNVTGVKKIKTRSSVPEYGFKIHLNISDKCCFFKSSSRQECEEWVKSLSALCKKKEDSESSSDEEPSAASSKPSEVDSSSRTSNSIIKAGYCVKQGAVRKNWKRRYFVLDRGGLSYYKSEKDTSAIKKIPINDLCDCKKSDQAVQLFRDNLFEVITYSRTFFIQAESPEDMLDWIKVVCHHITNRLSMRSQSIKKKEN